MCVRVFAGRTPRVFLLSLALTLTAPALLKAQVFQWTDPRGVIHFTDNASSIPESIKGSTRLIVRTDMRPTNESIETTPAAEQAVEEPTFEAEPAPSEPQLAKTPTPIVHYNPQQVTIVVVNTLVSKLKSPQCGRHVQSCRGTFRPSFDDRRFTHPSVFDGGSRQYIQPK
ncbi:MAG: DUF4124 domain-containing protein [Deltaproteobacteria bacterium]|nr:DUF4124 domain-containing protein [Deltaproteobacteria bacterium]